MECINRLESEIATLRKTLVDKENELYDLKKKWKSKGQVESKVSADPEGFQSQALIGTLPRWAIERYSRQILLPGIGVAGQGALCGARALVVGCGGLGCAAAAYLAGAGVGSLGLVDYDTVSAHNLHRQLLHAHAAQPALKAHSAAAALARLNPHITITPYNLQLDSSNALNIVSKYDVVLDCTDNMPSRYLLNDACVITKVPLISGSALKMEGQITIYGYRERKDPNEKEYYGPCYRCVFPTPPPPESVGSCSADGVLGPAPGLIGVLQALEAIKLIVGHARERLLVERMVIFDGEDATFRNVKLRPRNPQCAVCSAAPTITSLVDYEVFCRAKAKEKDLDLSILPPQHRLSPPALAALLAAAPPLLVDVRSAPEFAMCRLRAATNIPLPDLRGGTLQNLLAEIRERKGQVTFICRRGNDSQVAARLVLDALDASLDPLDGVRDVTGGLHAWAETVDHDFPVY